MKSHHYILLASVLFILMMWAFRASLYPWGGGDYSIFQYAGRAIANGGVLYQDCWDHKGPGVFYLNAIPFYFLSSNQAIAWGMPLLVFVLNAVQLYLFWWAGLLIFKRWHKGRVFAFQADNTRLFSAIFAFNCMLCTTALGYDGLTGNTVEAAALPIMTLIFVMGLLRPSTTHPALMDVGAGVLTALCALFHPPLISATIFYLAYPLLGILLKKLAGGGQILTSFRTCFIPSLVLKGRVLGTFVLVMSGAIYLFQTAGINVIDAMYSFNRHEYSGMEQTLGNILTYSVLPMFGIIKWYALALVFALLVPLCLLVMKKIRLASLWGKPQRATLVFSLSLWFVAVLALHSTVPYMHPHYYIPAVLPCTALVLFGLISLWRHRIQDSKRPILSLSSSLFTWLIYVCTPLVALALPLTSLNQLARAAAYLAFQGRPNYQVRPNYDTTCIIGQMAPPGSTVVGLGGSRLCCMLLEYDLHLAQKYFCLPIHYPVSGDLRQAEMRAEITAIYARADIKCLISEFPIDNVPYLPSPNPWQLVLEIDGIYLYRKQVTAVPRNTF